MRLHGVLLGLLSVTWACSSPTPVDDAKRLLDMVAVPSDAKLVSEFESGNLVVHTYRSDRSVPPERGVAPPDRFTELSPLPNILGSAPKLWDVVIAWVGRSPSGEAKCHVYLEKPEDPGDDVDDVFRVSATCGFAIGNVTPSATAAQQR